MTRFAGGVRIAWSIRTTVSSADGMSDSENPAIRASADALNACRSYRSLASLVWSGWVTSSVGSYHITTRRTHSSATPSERRNARRNAPVRLSQTVMTCGSTWWRNVESSTCHADQWLRSATPMMTSLGRSSDVAMMPISSSLVLEDSTSNWLAKSMWMMFLS